MADEDRRETQLVKSAEPGTAERIARGVVRGFGRGFEAAIRAPFVALLVAGLVGGGSGGAATQTSSSALRIALVAVAGSVLLVSLLIVWRSWVRRLITRLEGENAALKSELQAAAKVNAVAREQIAEQVPLISLAERQAAYQVHETAVCNGLHVALAEGWAAETDPVRFVENNSLSPTAEVFATMLPSDGQRPRIELGLAEETDHGFRVTHASGDYTQELKRRGECYTGAQSLEGILSRKASAHFTPGGYFVLRLACSVPTQYLFALTSVAFDKPEQRSLEQHAALIKVTMRALETAQAYRGGETRG